MFSLAQMLALLLCMLGFMFILLPLMYLYSYFILFMFITSPLVFDSNFLYALLSAHQKSFSHK